MWFDKIIDIRQKIPRNLPPSEKYVNAKGAKDGTYTLWGWDRQCDLSYVSAIWELGMTKRVPSKATRSSQANLRCLVRTMKRRDCLTELWTWARNWSWLSYIRNSRRQDWKCREKSRKLEIRIFGGNTTGYGEYTFGGKSKHNILIAFAGWEIHFHNAKAWVCDKICTITWYKQHNTKFVLYFSSSNSSRSSLFCAVDCSENTAAMQVFFSWNRGDKRTTDGPSDDWSACRKVDIIFRLSADSNAFIKSSLYVL